MLYVKKIAGYLVSESNCNVFTYDNKGIKCSNKENRRKRLFVISGTYLLLELSSRLAGSA